MGEKSVILSEKYESFSKLSSQLDMILKMSVDSDEHPMHLFQVLVEVY